jgi:DNA-binding response OmpR family regulator
MQGISMISSLPLLIVEPDSRVAEGACLALEGEGYRVVAVQRSGQARMLFNALPQLAVLVAHCDHLDEDDGEGGFLRWAIERRPDLAVVALCTHEAGTAHLPDSCIRLAKPFDRDQLLQAVAESRVGAFNRKTVRDGPDQDAA